MATAKAEGTSSEMPSPPERIGGGQKRGRKEKKLQRGKKEKR
jgi:hypothetical protein